MDQHNEDLLDSTTTPFYLFAHLFDYYVTYYRNMFRNLGERLNKMCTAL